MIRSKGEAGTGNIVEAVRHLRGIVDGIRRLGTLGREQLGSQAKELGAPLEGHDDNLAACLAGGVCLTWERRIARIADTVPATPLAENPVIVPGPSTVQTEPVVQRTPWRGAPAASVSPASPTIACPVINRRER